MNKSGIAYLLADTYTQNRYGVMEKATTRKKVFVNTTSVTGTEWYEGGRNGLNPQFRFITFSHDYSGEKTIEYKGTIYTIYRTFLRSTDEIELYAELRKGNE